MYNICQILTLWFCIWTTHSIIAIAYIGILANPEWRQTEVDWEYTHLDLTKCRNCDNAEDLFCHTYLFHIRMTFHDLEKLKSRLCITSKPSNPQTASWGLDWYRTQQDILGMELITLKDQSIVSMLYLTNCIKTLSLLVLY